MEEACQCVVEGVVVEVLQEVEEASVLVVEAAEVVVVVSQGEAAADSHLEEEVVQEVASREVVVRAFSPRLSVCRYLGVSWVWELMVVRVLLEIKMVEVLRLSTQCHVFHTTYLQR